MAYVVEVGGSIVIALVLVILALRLGFARLGCFNYLVQVLVTVFGLAQLVIATAVAEGRDRDQLLVVVGAWTLYLGVILLVVNLRIDRLRPVAFASGFLEVELAPTQVNKSQMGELPIVGINLVETMNPLRMKPFMTQTRATSWGNDGRITVLHVAYSAGWASSALGQPFDFVKRHARLWIMMWMLQPGDRVLKGKLTIMLNGVERREIEVPDQVVDDFKCISVGTQTKDVTSHPTFTEVPR